MARKSSQNLSQHFTSFFGWRSGTGKEETKSLHSACLLDMIVEPTHRDTKCVYIHGRIIKLWTICTNHHQSFIRSRSDFGCSRFVLGPKSWPESSEKTPRQCPDLDLVNGHESKNKKACFFFQRLAQNLDYMYHIRPLRPDFLFFKPKSSPSFS